MLTLLCFVIFIVDDYKLLDDVFLSTVYHTQTITSPTCSLFINYLQSIYNLPTAYLYQT